MQIPCDVEVMALDVGVLEILIVRLLHIRSVLNSN